MVEKEGVGDTGKRLRNHIVCRFDERLDEVMGLDKLATDFLFLTSLLLYSCHLCFKI